MIAAASDVCVCVHVYYMISCSTTPTTTSVYMFTKLHGSVHKIH